MTNAKATKRALLSSALALFLCFAMLIGTTFAWFTDSVTSANNIIKSGNLDIELEYWNGTEWVDVSGKSDILTNELWEPGVTEVAYFRIANAGTLDLKYQFGVNIVSETAGVNAAGESFKLSDYIQFGVVENVNGESGAYANREDAVAAVTGAKKISAGYTKASSMEAGDELYLALVVWMPTDVGNVANHNGINVPQIDLGINIVATQLASEADSFGSDYDKEAWGEGFKVITADDLQAAINNGVTNIVLTEDITLSESIVIPAPGATTVNVATTAKANTNAVVIDLNGKKISGNMHKNDGAVIKNNGNLVIKNGTISSKANNGGSAIQNAGTLVIENAVLNGAPNADGSWPSYTFNNTGVAEATNVKFTSYHGSIASYGEGALVTLNNCEIDMAGIPGFTNHGIYTYNNGAVVVNGGTYVNHAADQGSTGGSVINGAVTINGGTFSGRIESYYGTPVIKGGTFSVNPNAKFLAAGLKAVLNNGKYVVVADGVDGVVGTPAELEDALTAAGAAGSGDTEIVLNGDIDLTGKTWTPIEVDGYHGAGVVTIDGQGATIYGLTAPLFAGGFAGKSGIVIKNLTIADSNIVGGSQGGGAFVDTADSMQVVTLENCHLINSTVSGERAGGLIGWVSGYSNLNDGPVKTYVTVSNCSVVDSTVIGNGSAGAIAGHPGADDYTYTTIEDCKIENVDVISHETGSWRTGAIVGTANNGHVVINNVTVENVTLTQDGVTAEKTMLYGRFVPAGTGTLVIDGAAVLANANSTGLQDALASGDANLYLPAGEYKMPSSGTTGTVTISGTKETVLDVTLGAYLDSADGVTIEGVTIKTGTGKANGNGSDYAALYAKDVTYVNCTFVGPMRVGRDGAKFINCTFTELGNDYVWTYGNDVTFEGCTFNTAGKAILIYSDGGNEVSKVTVKNCEFNSTQGAKAGAIANQNCATIEIDNYGNGVELVTGGNTYDSNFSGEWRIKSYDAAKTDVIVNGTEYTSIAIDGKTMTIDANKNVTVQ